MKSNKSLLILGLCSAALNAAEQNKGPMNPNWFYDEKNPFFKANQLHQDLKWDEAARLYKQLLQNGAGTEYDKENAKLNRAACKMARGKRSSGWASFDKLIGIPTEQQISEEKIKTAKNGKKKSILVQTGNVGIGDIFHFLKAAHELKEETGWDVTVSVPNFLKGAISGATSSYGLNVVGARDEQPKTDHATHIIGLLGHLKMNPSEMAPEEVLFTAPERAMNEVNKQILPILAKNKTIAVVFLGENRAATLIGGKQLPRDATKHGRHLDSRPFNLLLKQHPEVVLLDCGGKDSKVAIDEEYKNRYMQIAPEEQPFDTILALALAMNVNKRIIALGADNGPTNVFARALNKEAQRRMALIIPNGSKDTGEYDMRMENIESDSEEYTQMVSKCLVYKCKTPADQAPVIEKAYQDMTKS